MPRILLFTHSLAQMHRAFVRAVNEGHHCVTNAATNLIGRQ